MAKTVAERGRDFTARAKKEGRRIIRVRLTVKATAKTREAEARGETVSDFVNRRIEGAK